METAPEEHLAPAAAEASSEGLDPEVRASIRCSVYLCFNDWCGVQVVAKARASIGIPKADLLPMLSDQSDYDKVQTTCLLICSLIMRPS